MNYMDPHGQQQPSQQPQVNETWDDVAEMLGEMAEGYEPGEDGYEQEQFQQDPQFQEEVVLSPELAAAQLEREVDALIEEFPALRDVEIQQRVVEAAQQRADEIGYPEAWRDPRFVRQVFLAEGGAEAFKPKLSLADEMIQAAGRGNSFFA